MHDIDIRRLDGTLLVMFLALIRHRRTTAAAAELNLSQSAVSHGLGRLRALFGDPLFLRRSDGLQPTRRALELAPTIQAVVDQLRSTLDRRSAFDPEQAERVFRLAGADLVCSVLMPPLAQSVLAPPRRLRASFSFGVGREVLAELRADRLDLALGRFYETPDDVRLVPLWDEPFVIAHRVERPDGAELTDLRGYARAAHVMVSFRGGLSSVIDQQLSLRGLSRTVSCSVPSYHAAFAVAAAADLVLTAPASLARRWAAGFGLQVRPAPSIATPFPIVAVRHVRADGDTGLDWLVGQIRALAPGQDPA